MDPNRLRSRTRVTTFKFQDALGLKNRLRSRTRVINSTLNPNTKSSQIGIRCSGTKKCSQRYEIDHFCLGIFSAIQPSEILSNPPAGQPASRPASQPASQPASWLVSYGILWNLCRMVSYGILWNLMESYGIFASSKRASLKSALGIAIVRTHR